MDSKHAAAHRAETRAQLWMVAYIFGLWALLVIATTLCDCAPLGLGAPQGRAIPLAVKETGELGTCASSGYEVDIPPRVTVATVASVCVRPYSPDAGSGSSSSDAAAEVDQ